MPFDRSRFVGLIRIETEADRKQSLVRRVKAIDFTRTGDPAGIDMPTDSTEDPPVISGNLDGVHLLTGHLDDLQGFMVRNGDQISVMIGVMNDEVGLFGGTPVTLKILQDRLQFYDPQTGNLSMEIRWNAMTMYKTDGSTGVQLQNGRLYVYPDSDTGSGLIAYGLPGSTSEGGQIELIGAGNYPAWQIDSYQNQFRIMRRDQATQNIRPYFRIDDSTGAISTLGNPLFTGNPTDPGHAATKAYVDGKAAAVYLMCHGLDGARNLASGTDTRINYLLSSQNPADRWNTTNWYWTPPAGWYVFAAGLETDKASSETGWLQLRLYRNASTYRVIAAGFSPSGTTVMRAYGVSPPVYTDGTDSFSLYAFQNKGTTASANTSGSVSWFGAWRIGD